MKNNLFAVFFAILAAAMYALNAPLSNIIENWHPGKWTDKIRAGIAISAPSVMLSAIKRSEDGQGTVIRLYEVEGKDTAFTASGDVLPAPLSDTIGAYSVETYYLADGSNTWEKVLLTEYQE